MLGDLYQFPAPVPIRGTVRDSAHLPLAGAEIVAYAVVTDEHTGTRAVRIARAVADATGTYALLLPPEL